MIRCYELNSKFYKNGIEFESFNEIEKCLKLNINEIHKIPVQAIILMIDEYSKRIASNKEILRMEGVPFLCFYLKKVNIEKQLRVNIGNIQYLNKFVNIDDEKYMKAQCRGIVCHWIASNVPTLGIYSVLQSIICKNSNILRIPKENMGTVHELLKFFQDINVKYEGKMYSSESILKNIALVYFDSKNKKINIEMSLKADVRVIWGGKEAVDSISLLPKKTTCKDLIFGPKYSFAVFDKETIESDDLSKHLESMAMEIIAFNQKACSSPQVVFLEKSSLSIEEVGKRLSEVFGKIIKRYKNLDLEQSVAANIINKRGEYLLDIYKTLYISKGLQYTILIDNEIKLEEPVFGRTIFLKEVDNLIDVCALVTHNIQTVGIALKNKDKTLELADKLTCCGVDRVVKIGYMNFYDSPWDGSLIMNELVRWCCLNIK